MQKTINIKPYQVVPQKKLDGYLTQWFSIPGELECLPIRYMRGFEPVIGNKILFGNFFITPSCYCRIKKIKDKNLITKLNRIENTFF